MSVIYSAVILLRNYSTLLYSTLHYSTLRCAALHCSTFHYSARLYLTLKVCNSSSTYLSSHSLNAKPSDLPNPVTEWDTFYKAVSVLNDAEHTVWNPLTSKLEKWIDMKRLKAQYGKSGESLSLSSKCRRGCVCGVVWCAVM
jgi:hypothetical protein